MTFEPNPGMRIDLGESLIEFVPIVNKGPAAVFVYAEVGKEATVYKVKTNEEYYALKIFFPSLRDERLIENTEKIQKIHNMNGLRAADRSIITYASHQKVVSKFPELDYAILMPWIQGDLWGNIMFQGTILRAQECTRIAYLLMTVMCNFEAHELAHCDLSNNNFIFDDRLSSLELIDIERMYAPNMSVPVPDISYGTPGYRTQWIAEKGLWGAKGDRFASAILCSEILSWRYPKIRSSKHSDASFFGEDEIGQKSERFTEMKDCLQRLHPDLPNLFEEAWFSKNQNGCPPIYEWKDAVEKLSFYEGDNAGTSFSSHHDITKLLKVFLCHASMDKPKVINLYNLLIKEGWIDPWFDIMKLKPGQVWELEIETAVKNSDIVVVCLSKESVTREGFIQKEIRWALDKAEEKPDNSIFIIPLRFEDCEVPSRLRKWHWLNASTDDWYIRLLESLEIRAKSLGL